MLFRGEAESPHPLLRAFRPVWSQVLKAQELFSQSFEIAEVLTRLIKNTVLSSGAHMVVALQNFCLVNLRSLQVCDQYQWDTSYLDSPNQAIQTSNIYHLGNRFVLSFQARRVAC